MKQKHTCAAELNRIALPLILSSISGVLMGILDQAFVGHLSLDAFAGVGLVCSCINSLVGVLGAFSTVFNISGSRLRGSQDAEGLREEFSLWLFLSGLIGLILFLLFDLFSYPILRTGFGLTGAALREAVRYLRIFSLSIPLNLMIFIYNGVFKIFRKTGHIFAVTLAVNLINIFLDYILIFGKWGAPKLGTSGAAIGTVAALVLNLCVYAWIARPYLTFSLNIRELASKIRDRLLFSLPFLGQETMEDILFVVGLNMMLGRMGTLELSAYNLIGQIIALIQMPMFGYGQAATSLISEAQGRKDRQAIRSIRRCALGILALWFIFLFSVVLANSRNIITLISADSSLLVLASFCLPAALLIQAANYGLTIEKAALQATGYSGPTLLTTFIVNLIALAGIWLFARDLRSIYLILGMGYLASWGILHRIFAKIKG